VLHDLLILPAGFAAKRQTAGIKFIQAKNQHFRPAGATRCKIHVKFGKTEGHMGPLSRVKSVPGVGTRPQKWQKFPLFSKESPTGANPFTDFHNCWGLLYAQLSCISILHVTRFASQITELLLRNRASVIYPEFFRAPCRKNYALDRKTIGTF